MSELTLEQKLAYLQQQMQELKTLEQSVKSSMKNLEREKNKKPITVSIHEAQSSGKFSIKLERGGVKHYLQADFIEYILNHSEDMKKFVAESNKLNTDKELAKTQENKVA